jgi:DNA-binding GntR family transcriptional regulator
MQPMRAALGQLRALGFVTVTPQVGCRVVSPSVDDIRDFFRLFARMEGVIASLAAERHAVPELLRLHVIHRSIERCKLGESGVPQEYAQLVRDWHAEIRGMARSPSLAARLKADWNMSDFLMWQGAPTMTDDGVQAANAQRAAILQAIGERDAAGSELLMFEHVRDKPYRGGILQPPL